MPADTLGQVEQGTGGIKEDGADQRKRKRLLRQSRSTLTEDEALFMFVFQLRRLPSGSKRPLFFVPGRGNRTMNSEILAGLDFFERDKGIKREVLLEAINNAVLAAARKAVGPCFWADTGGVCSMVSSEPGRGA